MKKIIVPGYAALILFLSILHTHAAETVMVGGYSFPPFIEIVRKQPQGLTIDLINKMNAFQNKYFFKFIETSSKRRYRHFQKKRFDIIMFESIHWGWKDVKDIEASKVFLKGGEVYIAKADHNRNQSYFNNFKGKSMACILGYHYGFANFNADETFLRNEFNAYLNRSHKSSILMITKGRADIAVVTASYLSIFLKKNPLTKNQILISQTMDQEYNHTMLVRKNSSPGVKEINELINQMEYSGVLMELWESYGIK